MAFKEFITVLNEYQSLQVRLQGRVKILNQQYEDYLAGKITKLKSNHRGLMVRAQEQLDTWNAFLVDYFILRGIGGEQNGIIRDIKQVPFPRSLQKSLGPRGNPDDPYYGYLRWNALALVPKEDEATIPYRTPCIDGYYRGVYWWYRERKHYGQSFFSIVKNWAIPVASLFVPVIGQVYFTTKGVVEFGTKVVTGKIKLSDIANGLADLSGLPGIDQTKLAIAVNRGLNIYNTGDTVYDTTKDIINGDITIDTVLTVKDLADQAGVDNLVKGINIDLNNPLPNISNPFNGINEIVNPIINVGESIVNAGKTIVDPVVDTAKQGIEIIEPLTDIDMPDIDLPDIPNIGEPDMPFNINFEKVTDIFDSANETVKQGTDLLNKLGITGKTKDDESILDKVEKEATTISSDFTQHTFQEKVKDYWKPVIIGFGIFAGIIILKKVV